MEGGSKDDTRVIFSALLMSRFDGITFLGLFFVSFAVNTVVHVWLTI